jgi:outer membrane lipoprotein-sorting protein
MLTRGRRILLLLVACSLTAAGALTYKRWPHLFSSIRPGTSPASKQDEFSSVPPFATKEPDRYQATRIITSVTATNGAAPVTERTSVAIARDGDRRREEYLNEGHLSVVYLETPEGRFLLLPARKLYADLNSADDLSALNPQGDSVTSGSADFSPERLLHEAPGRARYEKLATEKINDRLASKYKVTAEAPPQDRTNGTTVTLMWIDDELGLPVRSETTSTEGGQTTTFTVELRDLKQSVDPLTFALPKDYAKVDYHQLYSELAPPAKGAEEKAKP